MNDETTDDDEKRRRLDFLREKLTPISVERAREIARERNHHMHEAVERARDERKGSSDDDLRFE